MGAREYVVRLAVFTSGERFPILLYRDTYQPVVLPTRYVLDECRETKQAATLMRSVRVLEWFYGWCQTAGVDVENRLRHGRLPTVAEISGFCRYLRARRRAGVFGSVGIFEEEKSAILSPATFNSYLAVIEDFLTWAAYEFIPMATPAREVRETVEAARERIRRAFRSNKVNGRAPLKRYGLSDAELTELRAVVTPGAKRNPFKPALQFRNHVIIELMLATGLRRGELLKLKLGHLPFGPKHTLTVERSPDDIEDSRRNEPQVKTREREIPIPKPLAVELWRYVQKHRKPARHSYLFTSQRGGVPLDAGGVNGIFSLLVKRCFPGLEGKLHPHILRHTFNNRLMDTARELGWSDDRRQKVQTYLNGWSDNSRMAETYTRRLVEAEAMVLAEKYQAELYRS
jgi:integrase